MRRTYISPEFRYRNTFGTLKMTEDSAFFGSKMMEIEDEIIIGNDNLVYNQLSTSEQIDEKSENSLPGIIYDTVVDKNKNHKLILDLNQSDTQKKEKCKWIITINIKTLLRNYLFATLKKNRTFEGVRNPMVKSNNVDVAIQEYIDANILSRYTFNRVDLYIQYLDLSETNILQYTNKYDQFIEGDRSLMRDFESILNVDESELRLNFSQKYNAEDYAFNYYYNLFFNKL